VAQKIQGYYDMSDFNCDLNGLGWIVRERFKEAEPFPSIILNDFLKPDVLHAAVDEFPKPSDNIPWRQFHNQREVKFACSDIASLPASCQRVLRAMNSPEMVSFLSRITGIEDLEPDPEYVGGGLHQIKRGGLLDVHLDFNKISETRWRRVNALLFANRDWKPEYGGHTELWQSKTECHTKILPLFNRLVIFETTDASWHGHPDPLMCPEDMTRKSFATYYYSSQKPAICHGESFRDTTWAR
jgi:hypothetical protein